ncbi:hypothetical protein Tco_1072632 [Tanacetum coccineum]
MLNSNIQELGYIENLVSKNESYDELTGNNNVISYTDYMITIGNDEDNYVPPPVQKNDMMFFVIKQMKSQVEKCNMVNQESKSVNESLTSELERYKDRVIVLEYAVKDGHSEQDAYLSRELYTDISDRNRKVSEYEKQVFSQKTKMKNLNNHIAFLKKNFETLKQESSERYEKNISEIVDLEKAKKELENIVFKFGQSAQTMHMLTKPQKFHDETHKTALGYQNPLYLSQARRKQPVLYNGHVLIDKHNPVSVCDFEETLILAEESRLKMLEKQTVLNTKHIDFSKLNELYEYFVPQTQLSAEQLFWSSIQSPPENVSKPKVFPKKLPSTSQVLKNLNNARELLSKFDECIKRRTTLSPHQIGSWEQSDIKCAFKKDVIPFFENLKETFKLFEKIQKIEDENVSLAFLVSSLVEEREHIKLEYKKLYGSIKQTRVKPKLQTDSLQQKLNDQIYENNKLRAQLKGMFFESQMNHNGTSVNTKLSKPSTLGTKLYSVTSLPKSKIESEPINAYFKNIRVMHREYLKVTKEHVATLQELLEEARALKPLDEHIGHAFKFTERIQELLVYVSASCPFTQSGNEKWAPATSHRKNNNPYVDASRTKQTIETITKEHASRSNTKNDRIPQPSSRSMKNKVEAHHRKFKSSANKNNHVSDCNANVKNVALSFDTICLSCNECLKWIPTGRTFNLVGKPCPPSSSNDTSAIVVPPGYILTTIVIPVDVPCPKLSLRYDNVRGSLSKCMLNTEFHPFSLHDFGFEGIIQVEELPP